MESVLKVSRTISGGVYRAVGAVARGARRILASVPLLGGLAAAPNDDDHPNEPSPSPNEATIQTKTTGGEETEAAAPVEETTTGEKKIEEEAVAASPTEKSTPAPAAAAAEVAASVQESVKEEERPISAEVPAAASLIVSSVVETTVTKTLLEEVDQKKKEEEEPSTATTTTSPAQIPVVPAVVEDKKEPEVVEKVETTVAAAAVVTAVVAGTAVADAVAVVVADNVEVSQSQAVVKSSSSCPPSSSSSLENRITVEAVVGGQAQTEVNIGEKNQIKKETRDIANEKSSSSPSSSSSSSSVVERKTSEELPPPLPSSPPPTPIDPSPLERAQHAAASPSALAEALKAPAEAANNNVTLLASNIAVSPATIGSPSNDESPAEKEKVDQQSSSSSSSLSPSSQHQPPPPPPPPTTTDNSFSREGEEEKVDRVEEEEEEDIIPKAENEQTNVENNFNENFIEEEKKVSEEDNEAQASVIRESEERYDDEPLSVEKEESGLVVEAKPAFVVSEDIERSIVDDKVVDEIDDEIVPPLPESPIPNLDKSLIEQETDSEAVFDPIEELRASHMASEGIAALKETVLSPQREINNASDKEEELPSVCPIPVIEDLDSDPQNLKSDVDVCSLIVKPVAETEIVVTNGKGNESSPSSKKVDSIIIDTSLEFQDLVYETKSKSVLTTDEEFVDNKTSNEEFEVESVTLSLNSYNDSESKFNERLAESKEINGDDDNAPSSPIDFSMPSTTAPSTNDLPDNDLQKITEPETPVENPAEISTTESVTEVQVTASPAPPAPIEIPVFPLSEPVITEDVASVTKAIEEIDISDKAVAAAVNEAIQSVNSNEIVNDTHHHNIIEE